MSDIEAQLEERITRAQPHNLRRINHDWLVTYSRSAADARKPSLWGRDPFKADLPLEVVQRRALSALLTMQAVYGGHFFAHIERA